MNKIVDMETHLVKTRYRDLTDIKYRSLFEGISKGILMSIENFIGYMITVSSARMTEARRDQMDEEGLEKEARMFHGLSRANRPKEWETIFESVKFWKEMENDEDGTIEKSGKLPNMRGTDTGASDASESGQVDNSETE